MKKIIKKLAVVAMAFTLLGTSSATIQDNSMKASALNPPAKTLTTNCQHNCRRYVSYDNWQTCWYNKNKQIRRVRVRCFNCGGTLSQYWQERYV